MYSEDQDEYLVSEEDYKVLNSMSDVELARLDSYILSNTNGRWQKVAMVVGGALIESEDNGEFTEVSDVVFGMRVELLVEKGILLSRGNIRKMRCSEIKRAK